VKKIWVGILLAGLLGSVLSPAFCADNKANGKEGVILLSYLPESCEATGKVKAILSCDCNFQPEGRFPILINRITAVDQTICSDAADEVKICEQLCKELKTS